MDRASSAVLGLRQPGELAELVEERELILATLDELSPPLREALLLSALEGFTAAEVATIVEISQAAAERRISRAKARFRALYTALLEDDQQSSDER